MAAALAVLRQNAGHRAMQCRCRSEDTLDLVAPWLGKDKLVAELPMPKLIDATIVPGSSVDLALLNSRLKVAAPDAALDDHSHWIARLKGLADAVVWSAYGILLLIAVATASAVAFATRAGLEAHHEIVELLHRMGAQSSFHRALVRAPLFPLRAWRRGGRARRLQGYFHRRRRAGVRRDRRGALPAAIGAKARSEVPWLIAVPMVSGLIAWATARISVLAALRGI